ncbi:MAG: hypothetical protein Unbinned4350contig1002_32 [Prokaryotic dsDNA virus sp.]|nr:MAG: hypothetical protein Unbinned4350contig1002_32 [Prokaryotic dsDNA virus sp.]|tara:strand:+ start:8160 stop:8381 length:222 start_codon:yes stop_codon:yes gene_type:complete
MKDKSFRAMVWHRNGLRAANKAKALANKTADPIILVKDLRTQMTGVGYGDGRPDWCKVADGFEFVRVIRPVYH